MLKVTQQVMLELMSNTNGEVELSKLIMMFEQYPCIKSKDLVLLEPRLQGIMAKIRDGEDEKASLYKDIIILIDTILDNEEQDLEKLSEDGFNDVINTFEGLRTELLDKLYALESILESEGE